MLPEKPAVTAQKVAAKKPATTKVVEAVMGSAGQSWRGQFLGVVFLFEGKKGS